jgi:isoleucyl-tRNA synthetase
VKLSSGDSSNAEVLIFATDRLPALKNLISDESSELKVVGELTGQVFHFSFNRFTSILSWLILTFAQPENLGEELESSTYRHDFNSSDLPVFCANHVTVESGSGLVHTAPSHGLEDFHAYTTFMKTQRPSESLTLIEVVDDQGKFNFQDPTEWSRRLHGKAALEDGNNEVICMLEEQKRLIGKEVKIRHKYPYDWRTKEPILTKWVLKSLSRNSQQKRGIDTFSFFSLSSYVESRVSGLSSLRIFARRLSQ